METTSVIDLEKLENDSNMTKDNTKTVANDASKERQMKISKNSDKPSLKNSSVDIHTNNVKTKTNQSTSQNDNVSISIVL